MIELLIDKKDKYDVPADKSIWAVYELNEQGHCVGASFWRDHGEAVMYAKRLQLFALKHGPRAGCSAIHVDHETLHDGADSYAMMDEGAEL